LQQSHQQPAETPQSVFTIGEGEIKIRNRNILWGLLFSLLLAAVITVENYRDPASYNNTLLWSILGFLVLANLVNYFRHLRYLRLIRKHQVKVEDNKIIFHTDDQVSELDTSSIAIMQLYRGKNGLQHIQLRLKNNRGIRLEGYDQLGTMADLIAARLDPEQITDRKAMFG
jgi:hypothetical protein